MLQSAERDRIHTCTSGRTVTTSLRTAYPAALISVLPCRLIARRDGQNCGSLSAPISCRHESSFNKLSDNEIVMTLEPTLSFAKTASTRSSDADVKPMESSLTSSVFPFDIDVNALSSLHRRAQTRTCVTHGACLDRVA